MPSLRSVLYFISWVLLFILNSILIYNLIFNARKWKRDFPVHQVVSVVAISLAYLILSLTNLFKYGVEPLIRISIFKSKISSLGLLKKLVELSKYQNILTFMSSLEFLLIGIFVISFTPMHREKIGMLFRCKKRAEPEQNVRDRLKGEQGVGSVKEQPF